MPDFPRIFIEHGVLIVEGLRLAPPAGSGGQRVSAVLIPSSFTTPYEGTKVEPSGFEPKLGVNVSA